MELKEYQKLGVAHLLEILEHKNTALLADDMGLGKTAQAITVLRESKPKRILIVCPASLTYNWENEFYKWSPKLIGKDFISITKTPKNRIDIVSYNLFIKEPKFLNANYDFVILDEAHYIKNPKSKRSKMAIKLLSKDGIKSLLLSGTPITGYARDFFVPCNIAIPNVAPYFKNYWPFMHRYCRAKRTRFGWDTTGSSNEAELAKYLSLFMLRRMKADVLPELPDKIISHVPVPMDTKAAEKYARETLNLIDEDRPLDIMKAKLADHVMTARKRLGELKVKACISFILDLIEAGERPVVFGIHTSVLNLVRDKLTEKKLRVSYIDGKTKDRQAEVDAFQNNLAQVFVGQILAAGSGITLTNGTCCVFVETDWNPGNNVQAEDRIHRIGQKQSVNIYYLSARNSLDFAINKILVDKSRTIKNIMEN